jgi:cephalosporin-C deacetylase
MKCFLLTLALIATLTFLSRAEDITDMQKSDQKKMEKNSLVKKPFPDDSLQKKIVAFWEQTKKDLNAVPINAKVEVVKEAIPYKKFSITIQSLNNVTIAGLLSLPVQGEAKSNPWPVIVTTTGYGGDQQGIMLSECQRGYAILQVFPRGQGESAKYFKLSGDKLSTNLDKPGGAYYQGAYADIIRMIDYIVSRPDIDSSRIAMVATSQGAGIALAAASLDKRIKAIVAHVPFLCNFRLAATIPNSLVKKLLDQSNSNTEASLQTLDYFDPFQLVSNLHVPVLMSAGGKDETCPIKTIQTVYDRINSNKQMIIYPDLPHTSCLHFYNKSWLWLDKYFKAPFSIKKDRKKNAE